jgi:hypothetical protein
MDLGEVVENNLTDFDSTTPCLPAGRRLRIMISPLNKTVGGATPPRLGGGKLSLSICNFMHKIVSFSCRDYKSLLPMESIIMHSPALITASFNFAVPVPVRVNFERAI